MAEQREKFADNDSFGPLFELVAHFVQQLGMLVDDLNDIVEIIT